MKLRAPHQVSLNGQIIEAGEAVEVSEADGLALIAKGWTVENETEEPEPEPEELDDEESEID